MMPKVRRARVGGRGAGGRARKAKSEGAALSSSKVEPRRSDLDGVSSREENPAAPVTDLASKLVQHFRRVCCNHVTTHPECKEYAPSIEKYMRNKFKFFGLKAPVRRTLEKEVIEANKMALQDRASFIGVFVSLWEQEEREFQMFGVTLLERHHKMLLGTSDEDFHEAMETVKQCICTKSWWDTVDMLSSHTVGYLVQEKSHLGVPVMEQWINDDNMWIRRTALLHQLGYKEKTDIDRLFSFCLERAHETEFFIRKAIGWSLRQYAWTDKKVIKEFVKKNKDSFSPLSVREALKNC